MTETNTNENAVAHTGEIKKYKVLQPIDFLNEQGEVAGTHQVDEVVEMPVEVGNQFVAEGKAEVVEETASEEGSSEDSEEAVA